MSEKTYLCQSCGKWNEVGLFVLEDDKAWWTCAPCLLREIAEMIDVNLKDKVAR